MTLAAISLQICNNSRILTKSTYVSVLGFTLLGKTRRVRRKCRCTERERERDRESGIESHTLCGLSPKWFSDAIVVEKSVAPKSYFFGAQKRKDSVQHFPSRTSGRRAVSAVSLFYYDADKQAALAGVGASQIPIVVLWIPDRRDSVSEVHVLSRAVPERKGQPPRESCALSRALAMLSRADSAPLVHTHTECALCIYRCGELNRFPIRFGNSSRQRATVAAFEFIANSALARCATVSVVGSA